MMKKCLCTMCAVVFLSLLTSSFGDLVYDPIGEHHGKHIQTEQTGDHSPKPFELVHEDKTSK